MKGVFMKKTLLLSLTSILLLSGLSGCSSSPTVNHYDDAGEVVLTDGEGIETRFISRAVNASGQEELTYSFTLTPARAISDIQGTLSWNKTGVSEKVADYLSVSVDNDNKTFTITKLQDFSTQARVTLSSIKRPDVITSVTVDLKQKITSPYTDVYCFQLCGDNGSGRFYDDAFNGYDVGYVIDQYVASFNKSTVYTIENTDLDTEFYGDHSQDGLSIVPSSFFNSVTCNFYAFTEEQYEAICQMSSGVPTPYETDREFLSDYYTTKSPYSCFEIEDIVELVNYDDTYSALVSGHPTYQVDTITRILIPARSGSDSDGFQVKQAVNDANCYASDIYDALDDVYKEAMSSCKYIAFENSFDVTSANSKFSLRVHFFEIFYFFAPTLSASTTSVVF